jgi:type III secretory pathway component EscS
VSGAELTGAPLEGLWLALRLVLPLIVVGALGALVAGALSSLLGIADGLAARAVKSLVVIGALALAINWMGATSRDFALGIWTSMASVDGPLDMSP